MDKKKSYKNSVSKGSPNALCNGRRQSPRFSRTEQLKQIANKFVQINSTGIGTSTINKELTNQSADKVNTSTAGNEIDQSISHNNKSFSDKITMSLKNILHSEKGKNFEEIKEDEIIPSNTIITKNIDTTFNASANGRKPPIKTYSNRRKSMKSDILESFSLPDDPIVPVPQLCKSIECVLENDTKNKTIYRSYPSLSTDEEILKSKVSSGEDASFTSDNDLLLNNQMNQDSRRFSFSEIETKERNIEVNINKNRVLTRPNSKRTSCSNLDDGKLNKISKDPGNEITELTDINRLKLSPNVEANIARMLNSDANATSNRSRRSRYLRSKTPGPRRCKENSPRCLRSKTPGPREDKEKSDRCLRSKTPGPCEYKEKTLGESISLLGGNGRSLTGKTIDGKKFPQVHHVCNTQSPQSEKNSEATSVEKNYKDKPRSDKNKKPSIKHQHQPRKKHDLIKKSVPGNKPQRRPIIESSRNSVKSIKRLKKNKKSNEKVEARSMRPRRSTRLSDPFVDSQIDTKCSLVVTVGDGNNQEHQVKPQDNLLKENEGQSLEQNNEEMVYARGIETGDIRSKEYDNIPIAQRLDEMPTSKNVVKVRRKTRKSNKFDKIEVQSSQKVKTGASNGNVNNLHRNIIEATVFCDSPDMTEKKENSPVNGGDLYLTGTRNASSNSSCTESDNNDRNCLEASISKKSEISNTTFRSSAVSIGSHGSDSQPSESEKLAKMDIQEEENPIVRKRGRPRKVRDMSSNSSNSLLNNSTLTESDNNDSKISICLETSISTFHSSSVSIDSNCSHNQDNESEKLLKLNIQKEETAIVRKKGRPRKVRDVPSSSSNSFINPLNNTSIESDNNDRNGDVSNCLERSISSTESIDSQASDNQPNESEKLFKLNVQEEETTIKANPIDVRNMGRPLKVSGRISYRKKYVNGTNTITVSTITNNENFNIKYHNKIENNHDGTLSIGPNCEEKHTCSQNLEEHPTSDIRNGLHCKTECIDANKNEFKTISSLSDEELKKTVNDDCSEIEKSPAAENLFIVDNENCNLKKLRRSLRKSNKFNKDHNTEVIMADKPPDNPEITEAASVITESTEINLRGDKFKETEDRLTNNITKASSSLEDLSLITAASIIEKSSNRATRSQRKTKEISPDNICDLSQCNVTLVQLNNVDHSQKQSPHAERFDPIIVDGNFCSPSDQLMHNELDSVEKKISESGRETETGQAQMSEPSEINSSIKLDGSNTINDTGNKSNKVGKLSKNQQKKALSDSIIDTDESSGSKDELPKPKKKKINDKFSFEKKLNSNKSETVTVIGTGAANIAPSCLQDHEPLGKEILNEKLLPVNNETNLNVLNNNETITSSNLKNTEHNENVSKVSKHDLQSEDTGNKDQSTSFNGLPKDVEESTGMVQEPSVSKKFRNNKSKKKKKHMSSTASSMGSITGKLWYDVGDLAWAKIGSYCYWPCLVTDSPETDCHGHTKTILKKKKEYKLFHIRFFGDRGRRSWIHPRSMLTYTSRDDLTRLAAELRKNGKPAHFLLSGIKGSAASNWKAGVVEADSLINKSVKDRLKYMKEIVEKQSLAKEGQPNKLANHRKSHTQTVVDIDKKQIIDLKKCEKNGTKDKIEAIQKVRHTRDTAIIDSSDDSMNKLQKPDVSVTIENQEITDFKFISPTTRQLSKRKRTFTEEVITNPPNKRLKSEQSEIVEADSSGTLIETETKKKYQGTTRSGSRKPFLKENEEWSSGTIEESQLESIADKKCPSSNTKDAENALQMTMDIQTKLWRRNNLFRGITKEKVCQVCLRFDDVVKCKGKCNGWFHVKCITNVFRKQVGMTDDNSSNPCTSDKSSNDHKNCNSNKLEIVPSVEIVCIKSEHKGLVPSVSMSPSIKSLSLLDQIDYKMKEVMSKIDEQLYGYPTDSSTDDFSDIDSTSGSCSVALMKPPKLNNALQELNSTKVPKKALLKKKVIKHVTADDVSFDTVDSDCELIGEKKIKTNEQNREFHPTSAAETERDNFKCGFCVSNIDPACFICKKIVSKKGSDIRQLCSLNKCGKHYHPECLKAWPQTEWPIVATIKHKESDTNVDVFVCPLHVCHTCVSDDPRGANPRCGSDKLVKCLRCPASYHSKSVCIPAGTEIFSMSQIICPRHLDEDIEGNLIRPSTVINSGWCFICSKGGDLICCETCPASFHVDCLPLKLSEDGSFVCEDCESGRYPLYDEVVWVKLGTFRWWPGLILFPSEAPLRMHNIKHKRGEFVVKFYGTWDHYWINRGRTFLFQEGDESQVQSTKKWLDCCFNKALEEAAADHNLKRKFKLSLKRAEKVNCLKPPPYIKIKINRPVGNVRSVEFNVSNVTPCDCDPNTSNPCGPDSYCLNRLLLTECNPLVCPAGTKCKNQCFEKREYPPLTPYRTEGRGWGLKTLAPIKKGKFVIEYVGDIINEEEYQRRLKKMHEQMEENYYFLTIDKDRMVDAGPKGNLARFMNHSCQPNCETQKWTVNGDTRVGLFASVDIPAESELTFNYNLECIGKQMKVCRCGAPNCSGFIGVKVKTDESQKKQKPVTENEKKSMISGVKSKKVKNGRCFICCKTGDLGTCSKSICKRNFHLECLELKAWPEGRKWVCPRHYCKICSKHTVRSCAKCIESYCPSHSQGNVTYHGSLGFVCDNHDPVKRKRSSRASKSVNGNLTPTTVCGEDVTVPVSLRRAKKIRRTTSSGEKITDEMSPSVFTSTPKKCSLVSHNANGENDC